MAITAICPACGVTFEARSILAVYCSNNCKCRAAYYRRQGRPVPATKQTWARPEPIRPQVIQPTIIEDDELPEPWRTPTAPAGTEQRFWQGTAIQRRQADGFVNATAMCKAGGRRWNHYISLDRTQEYMAALADVVPEKPCGAAVAGIPATASSLIHTIQGGTPALQGTWIHPRLAVDLARWISPAFAVWMDGWFLEAFARPALPAAALEPGVHVVAPTQREACRIWHEAIQAEVRGAIAYRLSPEHRHEHSLPLSAAWRWAPA